MAADNRGAAAVWTSTDGLSWQRIEHDEALFSTSNGQVFIDSVTAGGPGLVAVGRDGGRNAAAVWTSTDGLSWHRVVPDESVTAGSHLRSVTVGGPGLVAVGRDGDTAAVWTSVDGIAWQRVPSDGIVSGDGRRWMRSVTVGGPGLVAVGGDGVWISP